MVRVYGSADPIPSLSFVPRIQHGPEFMSESTPRPHFSGEPPLPDSELETSVRSSLQQTGYQQLRRLDVVVEDGQVSLSGRLPQFYLLQLAQQAVMKTAGVVNVQNGIEVVRG
jgi:osmotically-inducible protein OsmY